MSKKNESCRIRERKNAKNAPNARTKERPVPHEEQPTGILSSDPKRGEHSGQNATFEASVDDSKDTSDRETPGSLTQSQIAAIRKLRARAWSTDRIHDITGISKSTIHRYVKDVVVEPRVDENGQDEPKLGPSAENIEAIRRLRLLNVEPEQIARLTGFSISIVLQHTADVIPEEDLVNPSNPHDHQEPLPLIPRVSTEVSATRPRIVEQNNNGNNSTEDHSRAGVVVDSYNNGGSPVRIIVDPESDYLQQILLQLLNMSAARNIPFKKYLETGTAVEDLRNASFAATLVPGETSQEFRTNLLSIAKKANVHDRYRTDAGLDGTEEQR